MTITWVRIDGKWYRQRPWAFRDWMNYYLPWWIRVRIWKFAFPQTGINVHAHKAWQFSKREKTVQ